MLLAINTAIQATGLPDHIRLTKLWYTTSGAISGLLKEKATAEMLKTAKHQILEAAKGLDSSITDFSPAEQWYKLRVHTIPLNRYLHPMGMDLLKRRLKPLQD